jgi:hypothetical protein
LRDSKNLRSSNRKCWHKLMRMLRSFWRKNLPKKKRNSKKN